MQTGRDSLFFFFLIHYITHPGERAAVGEVSHVVLVGVCLTLECAVLVRLVGVAVVAVLDEPLHAVPIEEQRQGEQAPPATAAHGKDDGKDGANYQHLFLLCAVDVLVPVGHLVVPPCSRLPDEQQRPHGQRDEPLQWDDVVVDLHHVTLRASCESNG